ncbi:MAG TPA: xanthine dehydrogenase family protein subunit M, partial [Candidatus Dormibacteraeota bacterium]|nr:xanthine dehydrogenase family protein subunit M [Candidatus Dormibacteraeota bacterium]
MIPAAFEYSRATSVAEAVDQLRRAGGEAKVLAGGHSLIPLMRLRLAQPTALVDINGVRELDYIRVEDGRVRIGALTRHATVVRSADVRRHLPLLAEIASEVGDPQVRSRGTVGGVLAHADSAGDYPTLALMLDAEIVTDRRRIAARDFFQHLFTTPLAPDELVCEVAFPAAPGPHRYLKFRRRLFDWAIVAAGVQQMDGGWRVGLTNVGPTPVRAVAVEAALAQGATPSAAA